MKYFAPSYLITTSLAILSATGSTLAKAFSTGENIGIIKASDSTFKLAASSAIPPIPDQYWDDSALIEKIAQAANAFDYDDYNEIIKNLRTEREERLKIEAYDSLDNGDLNSLFEEHADNSAPILNRSKREISKHDTNWTTSLPEQVEYHDLLNNNITESPTIIANSTTIENYTPAENSTTTESPTTIANSTTIENYTSAENSITEISTIIANPSTIENYTSAESSTTTENRSTIANPTTIEDYTSTENSTTTTPQEQNTTNQGWSLKDTSISVLSGIFIVAVIGAIVTVFYKKGSATYNKCFNGSQGEPHLGNFNDFHQCELSLLPENTANPSVNIYSDVLNTTKDAASLIGAGCETT